MQPSKSVRENMLASHHDRRSFSEFLKINGFERRRLAGWGQAPLLARWSHAVREGMASSRVEEVARQTTPR